MISHQHQSIFVHIPKTAGTSIERKLGQLNETSGFDQDHRSIREIEPFVISEFLNTQNLANIKFFAYHLRSKYFLSRDTVTPEQYQSYFKFAFVRNSWSRVYSWYKVNMRRVNIRKRYRVPEDCSLADFVSTYMDQRALRSQMYWIKDRKGQIPMDFIGRFEKLTDDFDYICQEIGIEDSELPKLLVSEKKGHYTDFYDNKSRDLVYHKYREEIDYFGFNYGE